MCKCTFSFFFFLVLPTHDCSRLYQNLSKMFVGLSVNFDLCFQHRATYSSIVETMLLLLYCWSHLWHALEVEQRQFETSEEFKYFKGEWSSCTHQSLASVQSDFSLNLQNYLFLQRFEHLGFFIWWNDFELLLCTDISLFKCLSH